MATVIGTDGPAKAGSQVHSVGLPPGPSTPSFVQTYRYVRDPLPLLDECATQFGDMFTIRILGSAPWVFVWSPSLLKTMFTAPPEVLHAGEANATVFGAVAGNASVFTMDESPHLNRRRLLLPQFHGDRMHVYFDQIRGIADDAVERWPIGVPFAMNRQKYFVQVPLVTWLGASMLQPIRVVLPKLQTPLADGFMGDVDPAFAQQFLHVAVAQGEAIIEPDAMADDLAGEAVVFVAGGVMSGYLSGYVRGS